MDRPVGGEAGGGGVEGPALPTAGAAVCLVVLGVVFYGLALGAQRYSESTTAAQAAEVK